MSFIIAALLIGACNADGGATAVVSAIAGSIGAGASLYSVSTANIVDAGVKIIVDNWLCVDLDYVGEYHHWGTPVQWGGDVKSGKSDGFAIQESNWDASGVGGVVIYEIGNTGYVMNVYYRVYNWFYDNKLHVTIGRKSSTTTKQVYESMVSHADNAKNGPIKGWDGNANVEVEASLGNTVIATLRVKVEPYKHSAKCSEEGFSAPEVQVLNDWEIMEDILTRDVIEYGSWSSSNGISG
eukprot:133767_1